MQGQIVKIISNTHVVSSENKTYRCICRGRFRNEKILPLVGDYVEFDKEKLVIEKILLRKNSFNRPSVANIDQAFLITSLKQPNFSTNLLDKLISLMKLSNIEIVICLTKEDLLTKSELNNIYEITNYYQKLGYTVLSNKNLMKIKKLLKDKTSVFIGQTGAGKSTLLNKLNPDFSLETGEISIALGRGKHTTRVVELFPLFGGKVLDTPGFSALDFKDYSQEQLRDSFKEFSLYPCLYKDCSHIKEKECKVIEAVKEGKILKSRYNNYINILEKR